MPGRRHLAAPVAVFALAALGGCAGADPEPPARTGEGVAPAPVELVPAGLAAEPLRVGVLVSLSSDPGQGSDVLPGSQGAQVAAYRLGLGGADVELVVADDQGTARGARRGVRTLLGQDVAGIVALSTGSHLDSGLAAASKAGTAVLLPYRRTSPDALPAGVWMTGPDRAATDRALAEALDDRKLDRPYLLTGDGVVVEGIDPAAAAEVDPARVDAVIGRVSRAVRSGTVDSVVVAGSAVTQAKVVSQIQGRIGELPVLLTPEALGSAFAVGLSEQGGTTSAELVAVGVDSSDATTLARGPQADRAASYFAALRLAAGDEELTDLFGDAPFATAAPRADTPSHDAVVALVAAAAQAGSGDPAEVAEALRGSTVDGADGLAGPDLDFSTPSALADDVVVPLVSTTEDPGVRPRGSEAARLFWFALAEDRAAR